MLVLIALYAASPAAAETAVPVCSKDAQVDVARYLRQLSLDLLGRPPTVAEYRAAIAQGQVSEDQLKAMMNDEAFYARMREYHRALLLANVNSSVYRNTFGMFVLSGTGNAGSPLGNTGGTGVNLRGDSNVKCDATIAQASCNTAAREDPDREPATKACYDSKGIPLPVSSDYDPDYYDCTALTSVTTCADAVAAGLVTDKYLYYCDRQRDAAGVLGVKSCRPKATFGMTVETLDGAGRVIAFSTPTGSDKLDRCDLVPTLKSGVQGMYAPRRGCYQREGYETVAKPYWDPSTRTTVQMCAYEAQARTLNPWTQVSCEDTKFLSDRSCGCGPDLRRCEPSDQSVLKARIAAVNEEPLWIADSVLRRDEPYFNLLTTRRSFVNGTLSAYYQGDQFSRAFPLTRPAAKAQLPNLAYADAATWTEYVRDGFHSGVLTTPAYLLRFPTARSRVKEFYEAFLCQPFAPPVDGNLPSAEDACNRENNLAQRCGCNYCHATLEPTGAHWGRFSERSAAFLDPVAFPKFDTKCRDCALGLSTDPSCSTTCGEYITRAYDGDGANSLGMLKSYLYRTADEEQNIEQGPALLAQRMAQTGLLEQCAVKKVWNEFLGRPMTSQEQALYLESLTQSFIQSNRNFKALIQKLLTTDAYRRLD